MFYNFFLINPFNSRERKGKKKKEGKLVVPLGNSRHTLPIMNGLALDTSRNTKKDHL
jgi:hypothetical protein